MKEKRQKGLMRRFLPYFAKYKGMLVLDLFMASLTTICELVLPLIVRFITDDTESLTVSLVLWVGAAYLVLRLIDAGANYYMNSMGHIMGAKMETDMRRDLFSHLQKLSFTYFDNTKIGQIMSRITNDLFEVTEFAHHCPEEFFIAGIKIIASFIILCFFNVWLTLIIFSILPLMLLCSRWFNKRMRRTFTEQRGQVGELNARVEDSLLGVRVVKSFVGEELEEQKFKEGNHKFLQIKKKSYHYMAGFHSTNRIFDGVMYIAVVVVGSLFLIGGKIEAGELMAYLLYVTTLLTSVRRIVEFTEQFQRGMTGIERFFEIMDQPVEIADAPNAKDIEITKGEITLQDVGFRYDDAKDAVLSHIDLSLSSGQNVALVGPSGGGKTTLCNLIPHFYEPDEGKILIDGHELGEFTLSSLRRQIGVVQQDVYLFSGTVYDNIIYGRPEATRKEVEEAARLAGADGFIKELPNGYDTYVGERGVKLSGGQKQRISIARVFLKNPPILILDEATSALDNESERLVQASLEKLAKGRTTLTIAHRLTTIKNADNIVVLTSDGIKESGSHQQLMEQKGMYYDMYSMYSTN